MTCRTNGMKLECIERFLQFADDPSLGSDWLLERLDEYLAHIESARGELDRLETYLKALRRHFPGQGGKNGADEGTCIISSGEARGKFLAKSALNGLRDGGLP